jgi:hypothetical protein
VSSIFINTPLIFCLSLKFDFFPIFIWPIVDLSSYNWLLFLIKALASLYWIDFHKTSSFAVNSLEFSFI